MKLLIENWRRYLKEGDAAFHGFGMSPTQMRVSPQCDSPPNDNQWETGEPGCPQFTNERGIDDNHEDIAEAVEFLNNVRPSHLIAYSRGGAVALSALQKASHQPKVTFVAPAWNRGWVNGIENAVYKNGVIIHGTADDKVPLWHSADLSLRTGMPLYKFEGFGHVNILKHKGDPQSGEEVSEEEKQQIVRQASEQAAGGPDLAGSMLEDNFHDRWRKFINEEDQIEEKKKACKVHKGKRYAKRVDGECRSFGQAGKAKDGKDRIQPGTEKADAYCARSAKIKKCDDPPCANDLSRKKWKCEGDKSVA
jgi:transposase-like protein